MFICRACLRKAASSDDITAVEVSSFAFSMRRGGEEIEGRPFCVLRNFHRNSDDPSSVVAFEELHFFKSENIVLSRSFCDSKNLCEVFVGRKVHLLSNELLDCAEGFFSRVHNLYVSVKVVYTNVQRILLPQSFNEFLTGTSRCGGFLMRDHAFIGYPVLLL